MGRHTSEFEYHNRVARELSGRPLLEQGIIELRYIQGFPIDFVASELGVSEAKARDLARTALNNLKNQVTVGNIQGKAGGDSTLGLLDNL